MFRYRWVAVLVIGGSFAGSLALTSQESRPLQAAEVLSVRLSLLRQRSCAEFDDSFYDELTMKRTFRNISNSPVTVFLGNDDVAALEVAPSIREAEEGRFELTFGGYMFMPDISQERPVVLPPGATTVGEMLASVCVRRDTSKKLSFAVDPGRRYLRLTVRVRVRSGSEPERRRPRTPAAREWSSVTAVELVPVDLPSNPKLVDCRRTN
jgi:hypothetical protein